MLTKTKINEVVNQIQELMSRSTGSIVEMIDKASTCGALSPDMKKEGNYLLAKALVSIYFRKGSWEPADSRDKADLENLSHFL